MIDWVSLYADFFDKLEPACLAIGETMQKLAYLLLTASIIIKTGFQWPPDFSAMIRPIVVVVLIAGCIAEWPEWVGNKGYLASVGKELADEVQEDAWDTYADSMGKFREGKATAWDLLSDPVGTLTACVAFCLGLIGQGIMGIAKMFQYFFIGLALAFGPVFLALSAFQTTRGIAVNFLTGTLALYLWDLAWRIVDLGTLNLLRTGFQQLLTLGNTGPILAITFTAGWVILGYILAPIVVVKALTSGGNIGSALVGGTLSAAVSAASMAMGGAYALGSLGKMAGGSAPEEESSSLPAVPVAPHGQADQHSNPHTSGYTAPPVIYSPSGKPFVPSEGRSAETGDYVHTGSAVLTQRDQNGEQFIETVSNSGTSTFTPGNLAEPADYRTAIITSNQAEIANNRRRADSFARGQFDADQVYS